MALNIDDGGTRQCILATNNENNICEEVTYERNRLVIQGYTNTKGVKVPGLTNNNLRYYKTAFVSREKTTKNKKQLTLLATELLCIKEDIYTELTQINDFIFDSKTVRCFSDKGRFLLVIYNEEIIEQLVPVIANINSSSKVKVYVFAPGQYPFTEEFEEVLHKIELGALPDAIYKAYMAVLPKKSDRRFAEAANTESEVVTSTEETEADLFTENTAGL
jgi:adenine-specific DNA-methyltransferase